MIPFRVFVAYGHGAWESGRNFLFFWFFEFFVFFFFVCLEIDPTLLLCLGGKRRLLLQYVPDSGSLVSIWLWSLCFTVYGGGFVFSAFPVLLLFTPFAPFPFGGSIDSVLGIRVGGVLLFFTMSCNNNPITPKRFYFFYYYFFYLWTLIPTLLLPPLAL